MNRLEREIGGDTGRSPEIVARQFAEYKRRIERGDPIAIYEAILMCGGKTVEMPDWLADQLLKVIADHHLGNKPSWKGHGNKPISIIRKRIERDIKRRAVSAVRAWIKDKDAYADMPRRCIRAWSLQRIHHSKFKTNEDAYRLARFGLRGIRLLKDGPTIKCGPRTLRRAIEDKKYHDVPHVPGRIATVFGIKDPDDFFGTNQRLPNDLQ